MTLYNVWVLFWQFSEQKNEFVRIKRKMNVVSVESVVVAYLVGIAANEWEN